jgi:hypothetical protein
MNVFHLNIFTQRAEELHFSGLTGTASHHNMQKIRINGFALKSGYIGSLKFSCHYLQYVPASKHFDHV